MQCSTPHLCSPRILIYGYQLIYTRISQRETQMRHRRDPGRREAEPDDAAPNPERPRRAARESTYTPPHTI